VFSTNLLMKSFCVDSSCSRLTGGQGDGGGALPRGAWPCPHPAKPSGMSRIGSSEVLVCTICHMSFASLGICICLVEDNVSFAYGKYNGKE
jgi:hypothetical protein